MRDLRSKISERIIVDIDIVTADSMDTALTWDYTIIIARHYFDKKYIL